MNTSKKIISLLMCMLMVLTMAPLSVFAGSEKTLIKVEVTQEPYKTYYGVGDDFDPTGMIITATYDDGTTADVTDKVVLYNHIDMPLGGTNNIYSVTASYTENGHTENCLIIIKVREYARYLTSIEITKNPDKMIYTEGEYFEPTGMEVTAYYDEGSSEVITGYTYNTEALTTAAPTVSIWYTENGRQQGNVLYITVNKAESAVVPIDTVIINFTLPSAGELPSEPVYTIPSDAKYNCFATVWRDKDGRYNVSSNFEAGKTYSAVFFINPNSNEVFADPTSISVIANNGDLTGTISEDGSMMKVVVPFTIPDNVVVPPPHEHTYATEWSKDETYHWNAASCEHTDLIINYEKHQYGSEGICKCGDACDHDWSLGNVTKPATCKETGIKTYYCLVAGCGSSYTETISVDKNAHPSGSIIILPVKESTCAATGLTPGEKCTHCGVETIPQIETPKLDHEYDNACDAECNLCPETRTAPHTYENVITKATLTADGKIESKCSACGDVEKTEKIAKVNSFTLSVTDYVYDGKNKTPKVTVKDANGKQLVKNVDYKTWVASSRSNIGKYYVKVTLIGNYEGTKNVYFYIRPGVPATLKATQSTSYVKLTWDKANGAAGYVVYRYDKATDSYKKLKATTATSYTDKELTAGTKYTYKVLPYGKSKIGNIYYSKSNVIIETATKTKTPTITVTASGTSNAVVKWNNVSGESGYQVWYSTSKDGTYKRFGNAKTNATTLTVTGLSAGKTYYFKVRTYIKVDGGYVYSAYSTVKSVKIAAAPSITVTSSSKAKAVVKWNDVSGESGYQVWYSTSKNGTYKRFGNAKANATSLTVTGLTSGKTYYFKVRTYTKTDSGYVYGAYSTVKSVKVK